MHSVRMLVVAVVASMALVGCGGGKSSSTTQSATQTMKSGASEAQREVAALPQKAMAMAPGNLRCGGTKPVWVNMHSKAYHEVGDPYYGRTKNGQYMCLADAQAKGFHPAGAAHHHRQHSTSSGSGAPDAEPT